MARANDRFLNREGRWADFTHAGLELRADGALQLLRVPRLAGEQPQGLTGLPDPDGPAGIVSVPGGDVYFTDPGGSRIWLVDSCDGSRRPAPCFGAERSAPGRLARPRGLAFHRRRRSLLVADSGNDRVAVLALPGLELTEVWDERDEPISLATGPGGRTYVVDGGTAAVVELDVLGRPSSEFWAALTGGGALEAAEVAVTGDGGDVRVVVLARDGRVHISRLDGSRATSWDTGLDDPLGLAADEHAIFVGDRAGRRILAFTHDGELAGAALGYSGPVAAMCVDRRGHLLVHPGDGAAPVQLEATGGFATRGVLWGGPFRNPSDRSEPRHRLRARVSRPDTAHFRLHHAAAPAPVDPAASDPFSDTAWRAVEPDAPETLFGGAPGDSVWVGMSFASEGLASPVLSQIVIEFDHDTWLSHLPAVYQRDPAPGDVLARFLTLFEGAFDQTHEAIRDLPRLFGPDTAPASWLPWLAEWLGLELPEAMGVDRRRGAIAGAFERSARRGTAAGLRDALREELGLAAVVEEPLAQCGWWMLPDDDPTEVEASMSVLGQATVLASGEPGGAAVGSSAVLDGSYIAPANRYATALFDEVAHQFSVRLHRGPAYSEDAVAAARAVIDAERPAHTSYHLCVVEPRMRVGYQARLGVDAVVADRHEPEPGEAAREGGLTLGGDPPGRLGETALVGGTHLTTLAPRRNDATDEQA